MSNPVKKLKKNFKKIVTAVVIAAVAYAAFPVIAGALATGGAASAAGAATTAAGAAGTAGGLGAAGAAAGLGTAASTTAAAGSGFLGTLATGAKAAATAFKGASPMVKLGLIQSGGAALQGAFTPEPLTAAEQDAERLAVLHSQPSSARTFSAGQAGLVQQPAQAAASGSVQPRPVATLNPATGLFEQAS